MTTKNQLSQDDLQLAWDKVQIKPPEASKYIEYGDKFIRFDLGGKMYEIQIKESKKSLKKDEKGI